MAKTVYYTATSLDGFIADNAGSLDWLFQFDAEVGDFAEFDSRIGAIAMGSSTYAWLLANHVKPESAAPQPWPHPQPTWVFSSRELLRLADANVHYVSGDIRPVHRDMLRAADGKDIWIAGGGDLAGQFFAHGLLDEIILHVAPVMLGGGAPLLPRRIATPPLKLLTATPAAGVFVRLHYQVQRT